MDLAELALGVILGGLDYVLDRDLAVAVGGQGCDGGLGDSGLARMTKLVFESWAASTSTASGESLAEGLSARPRASAALGAALGALTGGERRSGMVFGQADGSEWAARGRGDGGATRESKSKHRHRPLYVL